MTRADMPGLSSISLARWGETEQLQATERAREARSETGRDGVGMDSTAGLRSCRGGSCLLGKRGRPVLLPPFDLFGGRE